MDNFERRFYDKEASSALAVSLLSHLAADIQKLVAEGLCQIAIRDFKADRRLKSVGAQKLMGLYKSEKKQRELDANPTVHRAINYMMILPDTDRTTIANEVIVLIRYLEKYLLYCYAATHPPDVEAVQLITEAYVTLDKQEARKRINEITNKFITTLQDKVSAKKRKILQADPTAGLRVQEDTP